MARSGFAGSYDNSYFCFFFFKETSILFSTMYQFTFPIYQQCIRVLFSPYLLHYLFFVGFLMMAILSDVRQYLIVVWICIYLIISDIEHLFMSLLAMCIYYLEKFLLRSSVYFLIEQFVFLILRFISYYIYRHLLHFSALSARKQKEKLREIPIYHCVRK